jgi:hypothetical protein
MMSIKLKYADSLAKLQDCPPVDAKPTSATSFRFVHHPIGDPRNFVPPAKLNPQRRFHGYKQCTSNALSLFTTKEKAVAAFKKLLEFNRKVYLQLGTHLAQGTVAETDGLATPPGDDGHFDLYEAEGSKVATTFSIVEVLVSNA